METNDIGLAYTDIIKTQKSYLKSAIVNWSFLIAWLRAMKAVAAPLSY